MYNYNTRLLNSKVTTHEAGINNFAQLLKSGRQFWMQDCKIIVVLGTNASYITIRILS